ncbi:MAG TPA: hypothetical protein VMB52_04310 [Verrucomicrobiae bacterium]|nr:hypothetical protein [Verrucomicrobiae bacterium]
MDYFTQSKLNLNPRTGEELRGVVTNFERKWQIKAREHLLGRRISED